MFNQLRWAFLTGGDVRGLAPRPPLELPSCAVEWLGREGGGGGGGGGTSTNPLKGVNSYPIALAGTPLIPRLRAVRATVSFNSLGTYRALAVQLDDIDLPDGSILTVTFYDDGQIHHPDDLLRPGGLLSPGRPA